VGGPNYREMLKVLGRLGPQGFMKAILSSGWKFVPEQWEVQMWVKVFEKLESCKHYYTCAAQLADCGEDLIPETNVAGQMRRRTGESDIDYTQRMMQETIDRLTEGVSARKVLILPDGPYAVPVITGK
jgi:hypothetical protein